MVRRRALSVREVDAIREEGMHWIDHNLYLQIRSQGTRSWLFRYWVGGKPKVLGLGAMRDVTLAKARDQADRLRLKLRDGEMPETHKKAAPSTATTNNVPTFRECARIYINTHESAWKNDKHRAQWRSTLETYVYPVFGGKPVDQIEIADVLKVLEPIWVNKAPTAGNIRGRIDKIIGWATAMGYRQGDNPAARDGPLSHLLPELGKLQKAQKHHSAVPYRELPALFERIAALTSTSAKALRFTILTAARTGEVLGATWSEIDLDNKVWVIPAGRMKAGAEHRVPLNDAAMAILQTLPKSGELAFPNSKGKPLSNMAMLQCLRGLRDDGATVHGFRATFSTWAREQTDYSPEVIEAALAHTQSNKVIAAYARTTYFERRRDLLKAWGAFCLGQLV